MGLVLVLVLVLGLRLGLGQGQGLGLGLGLGVMLRLLEMGAHLDVVGHVAGQREDAALVGVNVGLG